jgi:hypothetical protein
MSFFSRALPVAAGALTGLALAATPALADDRFDLSFDKAPASAGKPAVVKVKITPKGEWHMNLEFPASLKMTAPDDVKLAKDALKKADAESLTEKGLVFPVKFTPASAGDKAFTGKLRFAICVEESCVPVSEAVSFAVEVK